MSEIVNAAPLVVEYGTQDLSITQPARVANPNPQHLAKVYFYGQKGPDTEQLVSGAEAVAMYGDATFDLRSIYANHATVLANSIIGAGGSIMAKRIIPNDAGPNSSIILYLDVLTTTVDTYQKDASGAFVTDVSGNPVKVGTTSGYKVKWVLGTHATLQDLQDDFGNLTSSAGDQTNGQGGQSVRYPIFEFVVSNKGAYGNNVGLRFWAPNAKTSQMPTAMMNELRAYPYYFQMIARDTAAASPKAIPTILGDQSTKVVLKPNAVDPSTDAQLSITDILLDSYQNLTNPEFPPVFGNFNRMAVYQANIDALLEDFHTAEFAAADDFTDVTSSPDDKYLINIANFCNSNGSPYNAIVPVSAVNSVSMSQYTNIFAQSGSDGTMNDTAFAASVKTELLRYLDPADPIQDDAIHTESHFYDSGFPLATKLAAASIIAVRKDTAVVLGTYEVGAVADTEAEENSKAIALRTRLQMFPESAYFGTPVARGVIIGRSSPILNSVYKKPLPLTIELAVKATKYMGSGNGKWKNGYGFDGAPGSILEYQVNPSIKWVPATVRNTDWSIGLNWAQAYDRSSYFWPAVKTVYNDDTSVLNSFITMCAICTLNKIAKAAWREFSGVSNLKNAQLVERVNAFVNERVDGIFDGRFIIKPDAVITSSDAANGFSWTLPIRIYAPNMKTVMTTYVQAYRIDSYNGK